MKKITAFLLLMMIFTSSIGFVNASVKENNVGIEKNKIYLDNLGVSNSLVNEFNVDDLQLLSDVIITENLTKDQAVNLLTSWHTKKNGNQETYDTLNKTDKAMVDSRIDNIKDNNPFHTQNENSSELESSLSVEASNLPSSLLSSSVASEITNYTDKINSGDGTGAHWQVKSQTGFNKSSGNIDLPSVYSSTNLSYEEKDVPYMHFGFYSGTQLGLDMGLQYIRGTGWRPYIYGYDFTRASSSVTIHGTYFSTAKLQLVARLIKNATSDTYELTVIDRNTWSVLETISYQTGAVIANSSYSNVAINREVTLAFKTSYTRLPNTGSYIHDAKWNNVYLYNATSYSLWGSSSVQTVGAYRIGRTTSFVNSVNVNSFTPWFEDVVDINY